MKLPNLSLLALYLGASVGFADVMRAQAAPIRRGALAARADSLIKAYIAETSTTGLNVAIVRGRDTLILDSYGIASRTRNTPTTTRTIYQISSITREFTAAAIMRLVDQKKLALDDDVSKYLPTVPLRGRPVKIRQLLNNTSGIHSYTSSTAWQAQLAKDVSPDSLIGFIARDTFDFAPGAQYRNTTTGYVLLGMIIERVAQQPFATFLKNEFFTPLGLTSTSYCPSRPSDPAFAVGYQSAGGDVKPAPYLSMTQPFAAGALCSTARDLVRWQSALGSGRGISRASYVQMTTPDTLPNGSRLSYGYGVQLGDFLGHPFVAHDGGFNGFLSSAWYFPTDTLSVVVLANHGTGVLSALARNLARIAYNKDPGPSENPPPIVALAAADRDRLVGAYRLELTNGGVMPMRVFVTNGSLMMQATGQAAQELLYYGNHVFGNSFDANVRVTFVFDAQGRATNFTLLQRGSLFNAPRVP